MKAGRKGTNSPVFMMRQFLLKVSRSSSKSACWTEHHDTKTPAQLLLQCVSDETAATKRDDVQSCRTLDAFACVVTLLAAPSVTHQPPSDFPRASSHRCRDGRRLDVPDSLRHIRWSSNSGCSDLSSAASEPIRPFANAQSTAAVRQVTFKWFQFNPEKCMNTGEIANMLLKAKQDVMINSFLRS